MQKCKICNGTNFYKEAGYYFCQTCQTQNEDIREEVLETRVDSTTRLRKTKIRQLKSDESGEVTGWTSWELYNFVLIGLINELIELGVPTNIKLTVLQLWATYLGKLEVAFISTKKKSMPKLARRYKKRDAEIIYGKMESQKTSRKRKRARSSANTSAASSGLSECSSSVRELNRSKKLLATADYDRYLQSQASSEGDALSMYSQSAVSQSSSVKSSVKERKLQFSSHAKAEARKIKKLSKNVPRSERVKYREKHVSTQYKIGPNVITPMRLWAIIYLALRIHDEPIQLGDMLRYGKEGHLSYYKLDHLIPKEINLTPSDRSFLTQNFEITYKGLRRMVASMAKILGVRDLVCPDLSSLVARYCDELGLPRGIRLYAERLMALSPPKMTFDVNKSYIPNYEGRAIAFIIVVLKTLLALDGVTEYQISRIAEKINSVVIERGLPQQKLFSFREWRGYIECRKTILIHAHYPTRMKYSLESNGVDNAFLKFLEFVHSKSDESQRDVKISKHTLSNELIDAMKNHVDSLDTNNLSPQPIEIFPPSLTPLHSYFQHLINHPDYDIPSQGRKNFFHTKVGYMTNTDLLIDLAMKCGLELEIINSNVHFLEKRVPPFEQPRLPSVAELKEIVNVEDDSKNQHETGVENLNDYLHSKIPCTIKFDVTKKQYFDSIESTIKAFEGINLEKDFTFTETLPDGRLAIPTDDDNENEENSDINNLSGEKMLLDGKFCDKYNIQLSLPEKESIFKPDAIEKMRPKKIRMERNSKGKFVRAINVTGSDDLVPKKIENELADRINEAQFLFLQNDINISDIDNNGIDLKSGSFNLNEFSFFPENGDIFAPLNTVINKGQKFFRPYKEYWMYHCIFSRVKGKNFADFERSLPESFRWLLNECALITEMPTEDLYEEVCLIESYHSHALTTASGNANPPAKQQRNHISNKW